MQRKNYVNIYELKKRVDSIVDLLQKKELLTSEEAAALREPAKQEKSSSGSTKRKPGAQNPSPKAHSPKREPKKRSPQTANRTQVTDRTPHGHLAGTVYDRTNGKTVIGVNVILKRSHNGNDTIRYRTTKTDMEGKFFFLKLPLQRSTDDGETQAQFHYSLEMIYRLVNSESTEEIELASDSTTVQDLFLDLEKD
jgi:5-hydroxyisourate hydrolase-like protein (transthyretin family)